MNSKFATFAPKVSIIIPVYNGSNYLREAIDSALNQTYSNFEVIVVEDGSTDGGATRAIAESYGDRIRYLWQENGGCGAALNTGIAAMTGDYFSWLSHDDLYPPDKLARQVETLNSLSDKHTILYGNYDLIDARSKHFHSMKLELHGTPEQLDTPLYPLTRGIIHGCALLIPRILFERYGKFDAALKTTQDYDLWFRLFRHASIKFDPHVFVLSRVHDEQSSRTMTAMKHEGVALWTRLIEEVTPDEAIAMHGSHCRFLLKTAELLDTTPWAEVSAMARRKAAEQLAAMTVSVVIPFHNRIAWTIEALESARAQTFPALEIVLVDDGSTEDVSALLEIAAADKRIRYIRQDWRGCSAARNTGVRLATGKYVAFLDSDDTWTRDKIQLQLQYMEEAGLAFSHTSYDRLDERSGSTTTVRTDYFTGQVYPGIISSCPIATPTVMVRSDVIKCYPFPEAIHCGEDIVTWLSIAHRHELGAVATPLTRVRISHETTSISPEKSQRGVLNILSMVLDHPTHKTHHPEILRLIDLVRRHQLEKMSTAFEATAAIESVSSDAASPHLAPLNRVRIGWQLAKRGIDSLQTVGVRGTWLRFRQWQRLRAL